MCYHLYTPDLHTAAETLISVFEDDYTLIEEYEAQYHNNAFLHNLLPVVTQAAPRVVQAYRWGLIPAWVKDRGKAFELWDMTLNATCENIFEKPSFKGSAMTQRCLIVVNGFYENRHEGQHKYPYFVYLKDGRPFFLGGLYNEWTDRETGELFQTCAIITTPANGLMARVHNTKKRMPLIIDRGEAAAWLDPKATKEKIQSLMHAYDEERMGAHTVSRLINQYRSRPTNVPEVCREVVYPELALLDA